MDAVAELNADLEKTAVRGLGAAASRINAARSFGPRPSSIKPKITFADGPAPAARPKPRLPQSATGQQRRRALGNLAGQAMKAPFRALGSAYNFHPGLFMTGAGLAGAGGIGTYLVNHVRQAMGGLER